MTTPAFNRRAAEPETQGRASEGATAPLPTEAELLSAILQHLQQQTGQDFSHYKASTLLRRIGQRMAAQAIPDLAAYVTQLRNDPTEVSALVREWLMMARPPEHQPDLPVRTVQEIYQAWTLRRYAPPRLLVNEDYEITHIFNGAGRYLSEPDGVTTQNILQKVIPPLRLDLHPALFQAFTKRERTESRLLQVKVEEEPCFIQLQVGPVVEMDFPKELIEVVIEEYKADLVSRVTDSTAVPPIPVHTLLARLEEDLQRTQERLQTTLTAHESSRQELHLVNETLQATNEELKLTVEELETSKDELQAMNEEQLSINGNLKDTIDELSRANRDLANLLGATNVGVIFLDLRLRVKHFTPRATELFYLLPSDSNRLFEQVAHRIKRSLATDAAGGGTFGMSRSRPLELATQVHETFVTSEEMVQGDNGRWYILRFAPYHTPENRVDGVVITLTDITDWQRFAHQLLSN